MPQSTNILFLVNPVSGKQTGKRLVKRLYREARGILPRDNIDIAFTETSIVRQVQEAADGYGTIVAAGGDGTISQIVSVMAGLEHKPKLGLIPIGTGNDLARSLGIYDLFKQGGLPQLLNCIAAGNTRSVDILGLNNGRYFKSYFGLGIDAKISNDFNELRLNPRVRKLCSRNFSEAFYCYLGLKNVLYRVPYDIRLRYKDDAEQDQIITLPGGLCELLVTNAKTYAGGAWLCSKSSMADGRFEVTVIATPGQWIRMLATRLTGKPFDVSTPGIVQFQTHHLDITFSGHTCYQVDGETCNDFTRGNKHMVITIKTHIEVIAP